jgi:Family of unknown function (DUF6056)
MKRALQGLTLFALIPLLIYAINGFFMRPVADDFCYMGLVQESNPLQATRDMYFAWQSTPSSVLLLTTASAGGILVMNTLPLVILSAWWLALAWAIYGVVRDWQYGGWLATACASVLLLAIMDALPNVLQSLYWTSGVTTYFPSHILFTCLIGLLVRWWSSPHISKLQMALFSLITLVSAAFHPTFTLLMVSFWVLTWLFAWRTTRGQQRQSLLVMLSLAIAISAAIMLMMSLAPGTQIRNTVQADRLPPPELIINTARASLSAVTNSIASFGVLSVPLLVIGFTAMGMYYRRQLRGLPPQSIWISLGLASLFVMLSVFTSLFFTAEDPAARAYISIVFVWVIAAAFILIFSASRLHVPPRIPQLMVVVATVIVVGSIGLQTISAIQLGTDMRAFAAEWDARDASIHAQARSGQRAITVSAFSSSIEADTWLEPLGADATGSMNACAAAYYDVESLVVGE